MLAPIAPHIAEELWQKIKPNSGSVHNQAWPKYNKSFLVEETVTIVVQVNGKVRDNLHVASVIERDEQKKLAMESMKVKYFLEGKNIQKVQDMLDGNYKSKIQVGYSKPEQKREVGEKWTDSDGVEWEQKEGYIYKVPTMPSVGIFSKQCKDCGKNCSPKMAKPWDRDCFKADGRCYHCQLNYEIDLKAGNLEFVETLKRTPGVYTNQDNGGYGDGQMYVRGFGFTNTAYVINGQPVNDMENGKVYWSNWMGLIDLTSSVQIQRGLGSTSLAVPSAGGTVSVNTRAAEVDPGTGIKMAAGDNGYHKFTAFHNTGVNDLGWSSSFLLGFWRGDGWRNGMKGEGTTYAFSVGYTPRELYNNTK